VSTPDRTTAGASSYPVYDGLRAAGPTVVQWLGFAAAPVVLLLVWAVGLPLEGFAWGLALFAVNRLVAFLTDRAARGKLEVTAVGITGMGFITRAWVSVALLFALTRLTSDEVGMTAAVTFLALFTVDLGARSLAHLLARDAAATPRELA
jgi:hypothetical protein